MTSHYRHRRNGSAAAPFVNPMEMGEITVNTANRQLAVGDLTGGQPLALIAVRYFDVKSQYAINDFVIHQGALYVALGAVTPGSFNATQWRMASHAADDPSNLANYLPLVGGVMTGPLVLAGGPVDDLEAATKKYVDDFQPPPPAASTVPSTPVGAVAATNVQAAIAELDAEKVAIAGSTMTGHLSLPVTPAAANAVRKDYVDAAVAANTTAIAGKVSKTGDSMTGNLNVGGDIYANRGSTTGYVFLGSNSAHYVGFDGTNYVMPSGGLGVGGAISAGAGTFSGQVTHNGGTNLPNGAYHTFYNNGVYFASATPSSVMIQGPPYPTIAWHCAGYFGANFGMATDGQFYMGGWSHGEGTYYRFHTTRDGEPLTQTRLAYISDYGHGSNAGLAEPWVGAVVTGMAVSGVSFNALTVTARYRALQVKTAGGYYGTEMA